MESLTSNKPSSNDHWLYRIIPRHRESLTLKRPWEYITWALFGNDNDGIFGEGLKSDHRWSKQWQKTTEKVDEIVQEYSFKRFVMWQLRNPLHNFTFYVIGFAARKNLPLFKLALISTKEISFFQRLKKNNTFSYGNKFWSLFWFTYVAFCVF